MSFGSQKYMLGPILFLFFINDFMHCTGIFISLFRRHEFYSKVLTTYENFSVAVGKISYSDMNILFINEINSLLVTFNNSSLQQKSLINYFGINSMEKLQHGNSL